ncbi:MAG: TonB-dependent receptor [Bacteroidota bacterium]|nr:TonB-dependent receptor [Bacteroidota bacterium]
MEKFYCEDTFFKRKVVKKVFLIMRLTTLFLFLLILRVSAGNGFAQNSRVSLNLQKTEIANVLTEIEKQTNYLFFYNDKEINVNRQVNIQVKNTEVSEILSRIFKNSNIDYRMISNHIVLIPRHKDFSSEERNLQQSRKVTGSIIDASTKEPLIGVSVLVKGTNLGTTTDLAGRFTFDVPEGKEAILICSFIGYQTANVVLGKQSSIDVKLSPNLEKLDEVVIIGYGTAQRKSVVGAVDQISSKKIEDRPVSNLTQALQGVAANLTIQQKSMNPNDNQININIRGVSTMNNNDPLVVIDGLVTSLSSLNQLNPSDIDNISILKDAGSAAIYGSRSSNGVILITTKKGKLNTKPVFRINSLVGIQSPDVLYGPVAGYQNALLKDEAAYNTGNTLPYSPGQILDLQKNGAGSKWFLDEILKNALQQNYSASLSGGNQNSTYMVSAGYVDQRSNFVSGNAPSYGMERYNFRTNLVNQYNRFKLTTIMSYNRSESNAPNANVGNLMADGGRIPNYYYYQQKAPNGHYLINDVLSEFTPLGSLEAGGFNKYDTDYINGSMTGEMKVIKGLTAKAMVGLDLYANHRYSRSLEVPYYSSKTATAPSITQNIGGSTSDWNQKYYTINTQFLLDYDRTFNKHHVSGLLGVSNEAYSSYSNDIWMKYVDPNIGIPTSQTAIAGNIGGNTTPMGTTLSDIESLFGRASYSYDDKYYGEASFRYDGSSKFAKGNRWGFFPSISAGWRISGESFMDSYKSNVGDLKIRGSYGKLGNQNIGDYNFLTIYNTYNNTYAFNGTSVSGTGFQLGNPLITWEKSANFNIGFDATFLNNKLYASFDFYNKITSGILLNPVEPSVLGTTVGMQNSGKMQNRGWELTIGYRAKTGEFEHNISLNLADSKNKVLTFTGYEQIHSADDMCDIIRVGTPFASYYGYKTDGYFKSYADIQNSALPVGINASQLAPGDVKYVDINHDGVIDDKDRQVLGNAFPRFTFGVTYDLKWRGFDFSALIQGVGERTMFLRGELIEPFHSNYSYTMYQHQLDFWTPTNTNPRWPRLALAGSTSDVNNYGYSSETHILNSAYARLKNIAIGYTIPNNITSRFGVQKLRVSVNAQNLLTLSPLSFYDPESTEFGNNMGGTGGTGANSGRSYPTLKYVGFGLDLEF